MKGAIIHAVLDRCLPSIKSCNLPACCCATPLSCKCLAVAQEQSAQHSGLTTLEMQPPDFFAWTFGHGAHWRSAKMSSKAMRRGSLKHPMMTKTNRANDKIAGMVLCTIQTSTSEYPAKGAKRAHQTCIMNKRMQPNLKRSAEISLTTGRGLSPDYKYIYIYILHIYLSIDLSIYLYACMYVYLYIYMSEDIFCNFVGYLGSQGFDS